MLQYSLRSHRLQEHFEQTAGIGLEALIPDVPPDFLDLLKQMLELDPERRINAKEALVHPFFYSLTELKKYRKSLISRISEGKELSLPQLKQSRKF
jgi:serine/threonine protein kinase